jgi:hypothetical protein
MWNLLSIVREMFRRNDRNSIPLLEIITQQCLETAQVNPDLGPMLKKIFTTKN